MALSMLLPGLRMAIVLAILASVSPVATAAVGVSQSLMGVALVVAAGLSVSTVQALTRRGTEAEPSSEALQDRFRLAALATLVLLSVVLVVTACVAMVGAVSRDLVALCAAVSLATTLISAAVIPTTQTMVGLLQVAGRESLNLRVTIVTFAIGAAAFGVPLIPGLTDVQIVLLIGLSFAAADLTGFVLRLRGLPNVSLGLMLRAVGQVRTRIGETFSGLRMAAAPGYDGIILTVTFLVATSVAAVESAESGALVALYVSFLRTLVLPLKAIGTVAGRLVRVRTETPTDERTVARRLIARLLILAFPLAVLSAGLAFLVFPNEATTITRIVLAVLVGVQLMVEPIAGISSSMAKVLIDPTAALRNLALTMLCIVIPALVLFAIIDLASAVAIVVVLVTGRVLFSLAMLRTWQLWMEPGHG